MTWSHSSKAGFFFSFTFTGRGSGKGGGKEGHGRGQGQGQGSGLLPASRRHSGSGLSVWLDNRGGVGEVGSWARY